MNNNDWQAEINAIHIANNAVKDPKYKATQAEIDALVRKATDLNLSFILGEIYFERKQPAITVVGWRTLARRSGEFEGMDGPYWCAKDGEWKEVWVEQIEPIAARVAIYRKGLTIPMVGIATMAEYGKKTGQWNSLYGAIKMLGVKAEKIAYKKAFSDMLRGNADLDTEDDVIEDWRVSDLYEEMLHLLDTLESVDSEMHARAYAKTQAPGFSKTECEKIVAYIHKVLQKQENEAAV